MKAIIIARVSTEEQKEFGNSLQAQLNIMREYCRRRGFKIVKEFSFDESAYKDHREEFDKILDYILKYKEKIAICFVKVDRLSRNIFDVRVSTLYEKALKDEVELHFVSEGQVINSKLSAGDKFNFSVKLGLAKYYSDVISDNVKQVQQQLLRKGVWPGKAPYGYKNITREDGRKDIVTDDFESKIVKKIFEWYSSGAFSMREIRRKLREDYKLNFSMGKLDGILKNPFYYGMMRFKGKLYPHRYEPIISRYLYEKVQEIKAGYHKKHFKFAGLPFLYRGLIRCADCGCMITPEKKKGKYVYYHCTQYYGKHNAAWVKEEELTEQFAKIFKSVQIPEEILEDIVESLKAIHKQKMKFREEFFNKLVKEREKYSKRMEKLYLDRLDDRITESEYEKFRNKFEKEIREIDFKLENLQKAEEGYYITANYILRLAQKGYELFKSSELEEKRRLIKLTLQNLRLEGKTLRYDWKKPFDKVFIYASRSAWLRGQDSNLQPIG